MGLFNLLSKPVISWLNQERSAMAAPLSDFERIKYELKSCDVILVEGRSRVSDVIRLITQSPWTHAALYIGRLHDVEDPDLRKIISHQYQGDPADRLVIESLLGYGTVVRNLEAYEHDHLRLCRPARLGIRDSQQVIRYAVSRLGVDYDVRQIFDLARFLFPWVILPRRWRSSLFKRNAGRSTRTVCSTMIAEAFAFVQFPILPLVKLNQEASGQNVQMYRRNPKLCTPSDFDYSPYFKIIKYPFVDIHYHDDHHLLPWHGGSDLSEDELDFYLTHEHAVNADDVDQAITEAVEQTEVSAEAPSENPESETAADATSEPTGPTKDDAANPDALESPANNEEPQGDRQKSESAEKSPPPIH